MRLLAVGCPIRLAAERVKLNGCTSLIEILGSVTENMVELVEEVALGNQTMKNNSNKRSIFINAATGKWTIIGVLIAGLIRILIAASKGTNVTDVIGTIIVGVTLAILVYVFLRRVNSKWG